MEVYISLPVLLSPLAEKNESDPGEPSPNRLGSSSPSSTSTGLLHAAPLSLVTPFAFLTSRRRTSDHHQASPFGHES